MTKPKYSIYDFAESKWEFMRRNNEYIDDYNEYLKTKTDRTEKEFCAKWHISELFDPAYDFETLINHLTEVYKKRIRSIIDEIDRGSVVISEPSMAITNEYIKSLEKQIQNADEVEHRNLIITEYLLPPPEPGQGAPIALERDWGYHHPEIERSKMGHIILDVDITATEEVLIEQFRLYVKRYQSLIRVGQKPAIQLGHRVKNEKLKKKQPRFENHKNYLAVYDLRKKGLRPKDIQEKLKISENNERDWFECAERLVEEGFDPYRKELTAAPDNNIRLLRRL